MREVRIESAGRRVPGRIAVSSPVRGTVPAPILAALAAALLGLATPALAAAQQPDTVPPADTVPPVEALPAVPPAGRPEPGLGRAGGGDSVEVVDRVVAVAGDSAILLSEVQEQIYRMSQQGVKIPEDPVARDSLVRSTVQNMVDRLLLVQRALQEGVTIDDNQVQQAVQSQFDRIRSGFQSDEAFRQAVEQTGQNMFQYRQMLQGQARQELLLSRFRQKLVSDQGLPPAAVSDSEVRAYFDATATSAHRPASVSFERITVVPRADSVAADSALAVARKALDEIRSGTDFEVAARRYSDDPGTRSQGGDMGWIRQSDVVPAFADVAWGAPPGRAVGPVSTRFGFHIIKVRNVRGGEREISQILIRPDIDSTDIREARERAQRVADSLRAGADAERLGREYGIRDQETSFEDVALTDVGSRFGDAYARAIGEPTSGEVVGPFPVTGAFGLSEFVVLVVTDYKPAGPYRFEDVRDRIRESLVRQKQFEKYLAQLRQRMYVKLLL
jgi:peptidyl-prolyl cis-trans isomerase SurA